jgi:hypothetical protein
MDMISLSNVMDMNMLRIANDCYRVGASTLASNCGRCERCELCSAIDVMMLFLSVYVNSAEKDKPLQLVEYCFTCQALLLVYGSIRELGKH